MTVARLREQHRWRVKVLRYVEARARERVHGMGAQRLSTLDDTGDWILTRMLRSCSSRTVAWLRRHGSAAGRQELPA